MTKTIVMIGNTSWGMFRFRGDLIKSFINHGYKVIVLAPHDEWSIRIEAIGAKFIEVKVDRKGTNPFKDVVYALNLTRIILKTRADVVINYTIKPVLYGSLASWLARVPKRIAVTTGLGNTFSNNNLINKITKILYKVLLKFSTEVWFLNTDDRKTFLENKLVRKNKIFLLPGEGIDVEYYSPIYSSENNFTFTLISRMLWDKGVGIFAESAKDLKLLHPHLNFVLVGPVDEGNPEGIPLSQLESWHKDGILKYIGAKDDIRPVLKETSCLVHPTYYKEGLPRILMEANAMGIPCITTNIPGCRDVIQHQYNGLLVMPNDTKSLTDSMKKFLNLSKDSRTEFAENGRKKMVNEFSSKIIKDIYFQRLKL